MQNFLVSMSGPIQAALRYLVATLLGGYAISKGFGDEATWSSVASALGAVVVAGIGIATSAKPVVQAKAADLASKS